MRKEFDLLLNTGATQPKIEEEDEFQMEFSLPNQSINQTLNAVDIAFIQDSNDSIRMS